MKVLIAFTLLLCLALGSYETQDFEAELPIFMQVQPADSLYDYSLNFLKGFFISTEENRSYPLFKQCDSSWGSNTMGSKTICQVGCLMSSMSMALNGLGKTIDGAAANPQTLNAWLKTHGGYSDNLFVWGACTSSFSLKYLGKFTSPTNYIDDSHIVILNVHNGGHWVLATSFASGTYQVNDPGYRTISYTTGEVKQAAVYQIL
mmetsp:Transcript_10832/g.12267  ORF Transcript_10832/g.12267 Transcript_10832/m.12267 type:complete len:204 (-) Transcript_10832:32-643(-)